MESSLMSPMSPHSPRIGIWGSYGLRLFPDVDLNDLDGVEILGTQRASL